MQATDNKSKNSVKSNNRRFFNEVKISNCCKIFNSFIIVLLIFLSSCDNDPNEILIFKDMNSIRSEGKGDYFMTTRTSDGKSNLYTKEKLFFFFSKRNYKLRNWTTIKYSENGAYGSYLLFKDFKGQDPNGLEINRNSHFGKLGYGNILESLSDDELIRLEKQILDDKEQQKKKEEQEKEEKQRNQAIARKSSIENSIIGTWIYTDNVEYNEGTEKIYTYQIIVNTNHQITVNRKFYYYVYSIGSSDYKENVTYTSTYNIENENDLSTSDYATYNLVTKGDGWESYKIEYEYGRLSSFSFSTISSGWKMLKKM